MRIHGPSRPLSHNNLQMNMSRNRSKWGLVSWCTISLHEKDNHARQDALNALSNEQINNNTTRGTTPGLKNPALGEAGGRVAVPKHIGRTGRRARRAPGINHGGGNNQRKYQEKPAIQKTQVVCRPCQFLMCSITNILSQKSQKAMTKVNDAKQHWQDMRVKHEAENKSQDNDSHPMAIQASIPEVGPGSLVGNTYTLPNSSGSTHEYPGQTGLGFQYDTYTNAGFHENGIHSDPIDYVSCSRDFADNLGLAQSYVSSYSQDLSPSDSEVRAPSEVRPPNPTVPLPPSLYPMVWKKPPLKNARRANPSTSGCDPSRNESRNKGDIQAPGNHSNHAVSTDSLSIHGNQGSGLPRKILVAKSLRQPGANLKKTKSKTIHDGKGGNEAQKVKRRLGDESDDKERPSKVAKKVQPYAAKENRLAKPSKTSLSHYMSRSRSDSFDITSPRLMNGSMTSEIASSENTFHRCNPRLEDNISIDHPVHYGAYMQGSDYGVLPSLGSRYSPQGYSSFQGWHENVPPYDAASNSLPGNLPYSSPCTNPYTNPYANPDMDSSTFPGNSNDLLPIDPVIPNLKHEPVESVPIINAHHALTEAASIAITERQSIDQEQFGTAEPASILKTHNSSTPRVIEVSSSGENQYTPNLKFEESAYDHFELSSKFAGYTPDEYFGEKFSSIHEAFTRNFRGSSPYTTVYIGLYHDEEDHDSSDLLPWHEESSENVHPPILAPENTAPTGVDFSDRTNSSLPTLEWDQFDLNF